MTGTARIVWFSQLATSAIGSGGYPMYLYFRQCSLFGTSVAKPEKYDRWWLERDVYALYEIGRQGMVITGSNTSFA